MSIMYDEVLNKAKQLTDEERLKLIDSLTNEYDGFATAEIADAWKQEIRSRAEAMRNGSMPVISLEESRDRCRKLMHG